MEKSFVCGDAYFENGILTINLCGPAGRVLPGGTNITFNPEFDHIWLRHWGKDGETISKYEFSYEQWKQLRQQHPEWDLPHYEKPDAPGTHANGNTIGKVVGETAASPVSVSEANPPVSTGTQILDGVQLGLDAFGLIPGIGEFADIANAGISAMRGDWVGAGLSLVSAIPFIGWGGAAAKVGRRGANMASDVASNAAKRADDAPTGTGAGRQNNHDGGKAKGKRNRCILHPRYPDLCKALGMTGHHVVPDRAFRLGTRTGPGRRQITGIDSEGNEIPGLSEADGLVICVKGATPKPTNEHGKIHRIYDGIEKTIGQKTVPRGTATLLELEAAGATAVSRVTGCNAAALAAQLRAYHQSKKMGPDFVVRADKTGRIRLHQSDVGIPNAGDL